MDAGFSYKDLFGAITAIVGLCALWFAVYQYGTAQRWKRNEFLAKEMNDFFGDQKVVETLRFFDYWGSSYEAKIGGVDTVVTVYHTDEQMPPSASARPGQSVCLTEALKSDDGAMFTEAEQSVRDRLDNYLGYIERLCAFRRNRLFSFEELDPFIQYHAALLNGMKPHSQGYHEQLFKYIIKYDYKLSLEFLRRYPQSDIVKGTIGALDP